MSLSVYQLGLLFYRLAIRLASPFNAKAKLSIKGRKGLIKRITSDMSEEKSKKVWFHCASLGEFEQGRPVIEKFKTTFPDYKIVLTFFSPSGYEVRKNYALADYVYYLPFDSKSNARRFVDAIDPTVAIIIKYEFWHHYIKKLQERSIPILSISAIFRKNQIYFKSHGTFYLSILKRVTQFFVQNRDSKILLEKQNIYNAVIAGDTRFDRVSTLVENQIDLPAVERFKGSSDLMVIGSCWNEDLDVLLSFMNESKMKFIVAPHEINGSCQQKILKESIRKTLLYSQIDSMQGDEEILVVDNVGLLSSLYAYGEYAYVGGAFGDGLHNILEAATYGIPIFFGNKNYQKFNEAVELIKLGGAAAIGNETELRQQFQVFSNDKTMELTGQINRDYVKDNTGATDKIIAYCKNVLEL